MLRLLAPLLSGFASGSLKNAVKQTRNQAICYTIVGLSLFIALIFLCVIAFIALTAVVKPIWAATLLCVFWLIVALFAYLIGRFVANKKQQLYEKQMQEERNSLLVATALSAVPAILGNKKLMTLAMPLIGLAGLMFLGKDSSKK